MNTGIWNLNTLQTALTGAIVVAMALLKFAGCTELPTGVPDCSASWLGEHVGQATLVWIAGILGFVKLTVIPWFQPGGFLRNLFSPKAPIVQPSEAQPGVVTPAQVATQGK